MRGLKALKSAIDSRALVLMVFSMVNIVGFIVFFSFLPVIFIVELNLSERAYALIMLAETMSFSAGSLLSTSKIAVGREIPVAATGGMLIVAPLFLLIKTSNLTSIILLSALYGLSSGLAFNPAYAYVSKRLPKEAEGLGLNVLDTVVNQAMLSGLAIDALASLFGIRGAVTIAVEVLGVVALRSTIAGVAQLKSES